MQLLWGVPWLPPSITGLTRLQRLCAQRDSTEDFHDHSLPGGPWLASLRWLGLPYGCLSLPEALAALRSATRLELLCSLRYPRLVGNETSSEERFNAFFEFVAAHPPLRCFSEVAGAGGGGGASMLGRPRRLCCCLRP